MSCIDTKQAGIARDVIPSSRKLLTIGRPACDTEVMVRIYPQALGDAPLKASIVVFCPRSEVIPWALRYFDQRKRVVSIGVPLRAFGIPTFARIFRHVNVEIEAVSVKTAFTPRYEDALNITWSSVKGNAFPTLRGVLTARAHSTHATLHFAGSYTPPFGIAGRFFDRIIGRFIARVSIGTLLHDVKRYIERINIDEHHDASFAAFESNRRGSHGKHAHGVPLHGSVAIRRDGEYVACSISLEGEAPGFDTLAPGEYVLGNAVVETLVCALSKTDLHIVRKNGAS